jgi:hypothetical protein
VKTEAMHGARGDDDHGGSFDLGMRSLEIGGHGTGCDIHTLAQTGVAMSADLPQILAASRLYIFDVQRIGLPYCPRRFAV